MRPSEHGQSPKPVAHRAERPRSLSPEATVRLVSAVGGELDHLRTDVTDELLLIHLLVEAGHLEAASRLIDEQSERMRQFQDRVEAAIASAVVERTAEEILAAAADDEAGLDVPAEGGGETVAFDAHGTTVAERAPRTRARPLVTAACLLALVAVFVTGGPLPGLYKLVSGQSSDSAPVGRAGDRPLAKDRSAAPDAGFASRPAEQEVAPPRLESVQPEGSAEAPEILLLLGRLVRFAEGTSSAPVAALLDVDRLVARLVTEVAPLLAPLPSDSGQEEAARASQPAQPNTAPRTQASSEPQTPAAGQPPANQPQPGQAPPQAPWVTQPQAPTDEGVERDRMDDSWLRRRDGEPAPEPTAASSEFPSRLGQRP